MIYDRKNQRFRLVPIKNHIKFEKVKSGKRKNANQARDGQDSASLFDSISESAAGMAPPKKDPPKKKSNLTGLLKKMQDNISMVNR
jgi:hypothetical protein